MNIFLAILSLESFAYALGNAESICTCTCGQASLRLQKDSYDGNSNAPKRKRIEARAEEGGRFGLIISGPNISTKGRWGDWEFCPNGTYAIGFGTKTPLMDEISTDKMGLLGIRLHCGKPGSSHIKYKGNYKDDPYTISSLVDNGHESYGIGTRWDHHHRCHNGLLIGFNLRIDNPHQGDNLAVTNVRFTCSNTKIGKTEGIIHEPIQGIYQNTEFKCAKLHSICGIKTLVDKTLSRPDNTGINNVQMFCCNIPDPAENCEASDNWMEVISCQNKGTKNGINCVYEYSQGISHTVTTSESGFDNWETHASVGFGIGQSFEHVKLNMGVNYGISKTTGVEWHKESKDTFSVNKKTRAAFEVPPGMSYKLSQAEGICGDFTIASSKFKLEHFDSESKKIYETTFTHDEL